ncbi:MAG: serine/threonine-protein kinase, partial [Polyangiaceae bacterium]
MSSMNDPFGWVGHTIDEAFLVEEVVGEGGFAVVYRGHHKGFDEKVAIKALKFPAKLGETERSRFLESFTSEGKLLRKLSSADASIVQALDVGAAESPNKTWTPYLILEWLEGESLDQELKRRSAEGKGGRSLADAMALLEPAAKGLGTAHGLGVAHRDIKPANLFLVKNGGKTTLKVVDFGIAKVMTETEDLVRAHEATGESIHAFSPRYGAPEQFDRRFGATGPWTDVFALALVLEEVVAGKSPMSGDTSQMFLIAANTEVRPTLKTMGVEETDAVEKVLLKALAVEPKE